MKLYEIINNLDKSESNRDHEITYSLGSVGTEVGLDNLWGTTQDCDNPRLTSYWIANHLCTDTHVGYLAHFLDDDLVFITHQHSRKGGKSYSWYSENSPKDVRNYLVSLVEDDEYDNDFNLIDLDSEIAEGYPVHFTGQLLHKVVWFKGEKVAVIKDPATPNDFHNIVVLTSKGEEVTVDIRTVTTPWHTTK